MKHCTVLRSCNTNNTFNKIIFFPGIFVTEIVVYMYSATSTYDYWSIHASVLIFIEFIYLKTADIIRLLQSFVVHNKTYLFIYWYHKLNIIKNKNINWEQIVNISTNRNDCICFWFPLVDWLNRVLRRNGNIAVM